jgi:hypothetical protein
MAKRLKRDSEKVLVERYTIINPKRVLANYNLFSDCKTIPVAIETDDAKNGFVECVKLPTNIVLRFLRALGDMPAEKIIDSKMRTMSIVYLSNTQRVVVFPNFDSPKEPHIWPVDSPSGSHAHDWLFDITPEKNRAIVEQMKIHTR